MKKSILFLITMIGIAQCSMAQQYDYAEAVKMAKIGDNLIHSVSGRYTVGSEEENRSITYQYDHLTGRMKYCIEKSTENQPYQKYTISFDGEKTTTYSESQANNGKLRHTAFIKNEKNEVFSLTPFVFGYFLFRHNIADVLASKTVWFSKYSIEGLQYSRTEKIDNLDVDVFTVVADSDHSCDLYLVRQYLFRPIKLLLKDDSGKIFFEASCQYREIENGIYFPDEVVIREGNNEDITLDYIIEETAVNAPLSHMDFQITVPDSVQVVDMR